MPLAGNPRKDIPKVLPFRLTDYIQLVEWTGQIIRNDKHGAIAVSLPPILERLNIDARHWGYMTQHFESRFKSLVGSVFKLKLACEQIGLQRTTGLAPCREYFP